VHAPLENSGLGATGASLAVATRASNPMSFSALESPVRKPAQYLMLARSFHSSLGRIIGVDPLQGALKDPQGLNAYTCAKNSPTNYTDPTGMKTFGGAGAAGGGAAEEALEQNPAAASRAAGASSLARGSAVEFAWRVKGSNKISSAILSGSVVVSLSSASALSSGQGSYSATREGSSTSSSTPAYKPAPRELIGTSEYYAWRWENAPDSLKNDKGDIYYKVAEQILKDFQELRITASADLRDSSDKAGRLLQVALEQQLRTNPGIESSRAPLMSAAVDTHSTAYLAAGDNGLTWGDRWKVCQTAGPMCFSREGLREGWETWRPLE